MIAFEREFLPLLPSVPTGRIDCAIRMRRLALALLISTVLASAACGGGGDDSASSDTAESAIGSVTETQPPVTTTEGGKAFQITVPKPGQSIGPQSPAARVSELQTGHARPRLQDRHP